MKKTILSKEQLEYECIGPSGAVSEAFDLLFDKTVQIIKNRKILHENNLNLLKSIHIETGE